ncbi:MAG: hypothetical protein V2A71_03785, partial [Candidatus Eisenbacteria bacterium]
MTLRPRLPAVSLFSLCLLCLSCLLCPAAHAAVISVPSNYPTIQAAITAAGVGDTIQIASGTFTGPGNWDLSTSGKNILLRGRSVPDSTVIDCQGTHNGFSTVSSGTRIRALTIKNALIAVNCSGASPAVDSCRFVNSSSYAIYWSASDFPDLSFNTYAGNGRDKGIVGGVISESGTWHNDGSGDYVVLGDIVVRRDCHL